MSKSQFKHTDLQNTIDKTVDNKKVFGVSFAIKKDSFVWEGLAGDFTIDQPYFIGHSGLPSALAYYSPKENIYVVGTVNQVAHPDISFKTMIKLTQKALKK